MRGPRAIVTTSLLARSLILYPSPSLHHSAAGPTSFLFALAMSTTASPSPNNVRVVSYNLLSSKLARPSHFTHADPAHLELEYRLPRVLEKLDREIGRGFGSSASDGDEPSAHQQQPPPTIFALQEVCYPFASALHAFFAQRGYSFITGLYGRPFNGYMGVAIAYPLKDFDTINVDICRLSDERAGGWPREEVVEESDGGDVGFGKKVIQKLSRTYGAIVAQALQSINNRIVKRLTQSGEKEPIDPWEMSEKRFNVLLTVVLRHRAGGGSAFSVSNYHMPCAFFAPPVMNIHAELVSKRVQDLAADSWARIQGEGGDSAGDTKTIPYILAGDFNILPDSPHYKLLTTGKLDRSDPTYPPPKFGSEWTIGALAMDSAYGESEPEFTNFAHIKEDPEPFIGTLDYIFLSQKERTSNIDGEKESGTWWKVHNVQKLPSKDDSGGPFPNEEEPSDHLVIAADLELVSAKP